IDDGLGLLGWLHGELAGVGYGYTHGMHRALAFPRHGFELPEFRFAALGGNALVDDFPGIRLVVGAGGGDETQRQTASNRCNPTNLHETPPESARITKHNPSTRSAFSNV